MHRLFLSRRLLMMGIMAGSLLLAPFRLDRAHAMINTCRTDPLVTLSNGRVYDLAADIQDSASDIISVNYTLIGPVGVHVVSIQRTASAVSSKEHFTYIADNDPGTYDATIYVDTNNDAQVAAHFYLANNANTVLALETIKDWSQNDLDSRFFDNSPYPKATSGGGSYTSSMPTSAPQPTTITQWSALLTQLFGAFTCGC